MSDTESLNDALGLFDEPEDFRPEKPKEHYANYERIDVPDISKSKITNLKLQLVGSSPLWGHLLWNAGIYTARHLDKYPELVSNKNVLELGAASALPSLVAGLIGAKRVVVTDYPDADLMANIQYNVNTIIPDELKENVRVEGYIWGNEYDPLTIHLDGDKKFDLIILSDLVFNHNQHDKLLQTTKDLLATNGKALVVFSPHRPHLLEADLQFFETCKEYGLTPEKIEMVNWKPMFEEDEETAEVRSRVYAYYMTHA